MAKNMIKQVNMAALWLLAVGGLNWILVALLETDLVGLLANVINMPAIGTAIKSLIGVAGIYIGWLALMGKVSIK